MFGVAVVLCFIAVIQTASAGTSVEIDGATAAGLCTTSYPGTTCPDQLSPCQWDMRVIGANAAHESETGDGVKVGIIDSGIDRFHPDLNPGGSTLGCRAPSSSARRRLQIPTRSRTATVRTRRPFRT
jgi:hypothetical protein